MQPNTNLSIDLLWKENKPDRVYYVYSYVIVILRSI